MSKSNQSLKVGVIGAGSIGVVHIEKLIAAGAEVVGVCDILPAVADRAAAHFKIPDTFTDYRELLKLDGLEAITVALPNHLHCPVTLAGLKSGKHVLCEKPPALNAAEVKKMIAAARRAGRVLQFGLNNRLTPETVLARKLVAAGKIGKPYHAVVFATRRRGVPGRGGWFTTKAKSGGGPLLDIGVHMLDATCWVLGHPRPLSVSGHVHRKLIGRDDYAYTSMWSAPVAGGPTDVEDYVTALVRFAEGLTIHLECSWAANIGQQLWQAEILGDQAGLMLKPGSSLTLHGQDGDLLTDVTPHYRKDDPYVREMCIFIDCCRTGKKTVTPGEHGQYIQTIMDAIYRSAAAGREVSVRSADLPGGL